eukprot:685705-Pyramimonas_sp.AAC.1
MANLALIPTLVQQVLHHIWAHALTSQSSLRVANRALYSVLWISFLRLIPLPLQTLPPRGTV